MLWQAEFHSLFSNSDVLEEQLALLDIHSVSYLPAENEDDYQVSPGDAPEWTNCQVQIILENEQQLDAFLLAKQSGSFSDIPMDSLNISALPDEEWQHSWQKYWQPTRFGDLIVCCHDSTNQPTIGTNDKVIYLNPGLAFGTGTHETTALCLDWLSHNNLQNKKILDFGSGSGILAIGAVALGCQQVFAYDHDPQAMLSSEQNIQLNDMKQYITLLDSEEKVAKKASYDIILANIMLTPLVELVELFHSLLENTGQIIVSGILESQKSELMDSWEKYFKQTSCQQKNEWLMLSFSHGDE